MILISFKTSCQFNQKELTFFFLQGRGGKGAIYTFATGNGGMFQDSCAYNGYVNSIYTIAITGLNEDGSNPTYAEDCAGIMAAAYSRDTAKGLGKIVSKTLNYELCLGFFVFSQE